MHDRDPGRHLELGEVRTDELLQLAHLECLTWLDHDVASQFFTESLVRDAVHRCFVHRRMFVDRRFDLGAVDVLAAAQDHVLRPVADVDETLRIEVADVARTQPAVNDRLSGRLGSVPIAADE